MNGSDLKPSVRTKILMLERGVKPAELAMAIGLSKNYVYRLISGHIVTVAGRKKIEEFFGEPIWKERAGSGVRIAKPEISPRSRNLKPLTTETNEEQTSEADSNQTPVSNPER